MQTATTPPTPPSPVTCKVFEHGRLRGKPNDLGQISEILEEPGTLVWFDVIDPGPNDLDVMKEEFHLHPLSIEDAIHAHQRPKIEPYDTYWFVVLLGVTLEEDQLIFHEVDIFAGEKFLVTVRHSPRFPLEEIERRWQAHPDRVAHGGGFLLYTILDTVVDGYFPIAEWFTEQLDELEERLFRDWTMNSSAMPTIFNLKREGQAFRRAVVPLRDTLSPILRGDLSLVSEKELIYYRDIYDHLVRVIEELDNVRDLLASALDIQLSVIASRQAEVSKQLTIIATIFLPLSFIVGFFGQNFGFLVNHIGSTQTFWFLGIGTEVLAIAVMLIFFKIRGWF